MGGPKAPLAARSLLGSRVSHITKFYASTTSGALKPLGIPPGRELSN